jgi:dephospho-CoA kinase
MTDIGEWPCLVVGLTGGIASGKSLAAQCFADHGVDVIDTDAVARDVVAPGTEGLERIRASFGDDLLAADGSLDRDAMRHRIFGDPNERQRLEAITHPLIEADVIDRLKRTQGPYSVVVVPLLLEHKWDRLTHRVAVVDCPVAEQRRRLSERDGTPDDEVERILATQFGRAERNARADDILTNDDTPEGLRRQVDRLDERYRRIALATHR